MKYFIILAGSSLFFIGATLMLYFLWNIEQDLTWKILLIFCSAIACYIFIRSLQIYSKIQLTNGELRVSKLFSSQIYDLKELESWTEETNFYRVSYRKLKLKFPNTQLTLFDHADRANIEQLYHHLRTHYKSLRILT